MHRNPFSIVSGLVLFVGNAVFADQPIMNMMPRWDGGYGFQVRTEHIHRRDLKLGKDVVGRGFTEEINQIHLEGVYTWDRSIRLTAKLPYVLDARREVLGVGNSKVVQRDEGVGDLTLAMPLKKYFNLDGRSGNWSATPQIRVPIGREDDEFEVWDGVWGGGLSLSYETETVDWFINVGGGVWIFEHPEPAEWSASIDLGRNHLDRMQFLIETDMKWDDEGKFFLSSGPAYYLRMTDNIHFRAEWKHDFVSEVSDKTADHGQGDRVSVGIGFVY